MPYEMGDPTEAWKLYEKGRDHHNTINLYQDTEMAHRFYQGDQWYGLECGGEKMPFYNIIRPTVNYRAASVAMNNMQIVYSPWDADISMEQVCSILNDLAAKQWERTKMDQVAWELIKEACISGESYLWLYDMGRKTKVIQTTDIYFGDETSPKVQEQPYIIIRERRFVSDVRKEAKENGLEDDEISMILPDDIYDGATQAMYDGEIRSNDKCTCLVMMTKKDNRVHIQRSTRYVVYQHDRAIEAVYQGPDGDISYGISLYPLVGLVWNRKQDSSRGTGECKPMIPNQIEINRNLVRRALSVKLCAYPKPVYQDGAVDNPDALSEAGTAIRVSGMAADVRQMVTYLSPAGMSSDAHVLANEMVNTTRELAGAGDAATGQVDPTKTSGAAIIAARDQSAIPLNEQTAFYRQMVEDLGLVWLDMWAAYYPDGIQAQDGTYIPSDAIKPDEMSVKVDVTPTDPYSKYAAEQAIGNALMQGQITFEEYVSALPDNASAPKAKFEEIVRARQEAAQAQQEQVAMMQTQMQQMGGMEGAVPQM